MTSSDWVFGDVAPSRVKPILLTAEANSIRKRIGQLSVHDQAQVRATLATLVG